MSSPTNPDSPERPIGPVLRREREERGLTLTEVAQAIRIQESYLDALENDAPEDAFPGRVYARFFLRDYARYLRIPDGPLLEALDARWRHPDEAEPSLASVLQATEGSTPRRWSGNVVTTLVAVMILVGLVIVAAISGGPPPSTDPLAGGTASGAASASPTPASPTSASPTPASPSPTQSPSTPPQPARAIAARITATDGRCWVRASDADGTVLFEGTLEPGQSTAVRADSGLELDLGAAQYVRLVVNGQAVPTGENVVHLTLSLRDGQVVVA